MWGRQREWAPARTRRFAQVSLSNVLSARDFKERVSFLSDADQAVFRARVNPAFEVQVCGAAHAALPRAHARLLCFPRQVGLHELLGHGSGKVFVEAPDGSLNFDADAVRHPFETAADGSAARVRSWYKPGATWDTVFGASAS